MTTKFGNQAQLEQVITLQKCDFNFNQVSKLSVEETKIDIQVPVHSLKLGEDQQCDQKFIQDLKTCVLPKDSANKEYVDLMRVELKDEILNGAGSSYDSLQELKQLLDTLDGDATTALSAGLLLKRDKSDQEVEFLEEFDKMTVEDLKAVDTDFIDFTPKRIKASTAVAQDELVTKQFTEDQDAIVEQLITNHIATYDGEKHKIEFAQSGTQCVTEADKLLVKIAGIEKSKQTATEMVMQTKIKMSGQSVEQLPAATAYDQPVIMRQLSHFTEFILLEYTQDTAVMNAVILDQNVCQQVFITQNALILPTSSALDVVLSTYDAAYPQAQAVNFKSVGLYKIDISFKVKSHFNDHNKRAKISFFDDDTKQQSPSQLYQASSTKLVDDDFYTFTYSKYFKVNSPFKLSLKAEDFQMVGAGSQVFVQKISY